MQTAYAVSPKLSIAMGRHLQPGETLRNAVWAADFRKAKLLFVLLGSMVPALLIDYFFFHFDPGACGILWIAIWAYPYHKMNKIYILALTDRRLLLVGVKPPLIELDLKKQKSARSWPLDARPKVVGQAGAKIAKIAILDPQGRLNLTRRYGSNVEAKIQAAAILAVLSGTPARGQLTHI
jgi:hypothetical protein